MTATAPGRNDPCPCGSGKKYKKCCLPKDGQAPRSPGSLPHPGIRAASSSPPVIDVDDLDELSNGVVDLIDLRRFDEAEARCQLLRQKYPDTIDWMERFAMVYEAKGAWSAAAEYYSRAAAFARSSTGIDRELIESLDALAERMKRIADNTPAR